jgi:molecular chaperone DnaK
MMGKNGGESWSYLWCPPEEVSAFVLHELKRQAEAFLGAEVRKAVIAVPAHFDINQRQAVEDAARIAGLDAVRLLNEATAAGLAYAYRRKKRETKLLVFDLGGGTLDVSIIEFNDDIIGVIAIEGDSALGGLDFDHVIAEYVLEAIAKQTGSKPSLDSFQKLVLMEAVERAKIDLTSAPSTSIHLPGFLQAEGISRDLNVSLDRKEFESRSKRLVDRIMDIVSAALKDAGMKPGDLGAFLLVGNASQMPMIRDRIGRSLNITPVSGGDPKLCVVQGAAILAGMLTGETHILLLDVLNGSCGISLEGDRFEVLIEKNEATPAERKRNFTTTRDNQRRISVPVYQGNQPVASKNTLLGTLELDDIPPAPAGVPQIQVTFSVNAGMLIGCSAKDLGTLKEHSIVLRPPNALTPSELKSKIDRFNGLRS